jgi:hypothetical protein
LKKIIILTVVFILTIFGKVLSEEGVSIVDDVQYGTVKINGNLTVEVADDSKKTYLIKPDNDPCKLPVNTYYINHWIIESKETKDKLWKLKGDYVNRANYLVVTENNQTELEIDTTVTSSLKVRKRDEKYVFSLDLLGKKGELITILHNDKRYEPRLHIKNGDGSYKTDLVFSYG